MDTRRQPIHTYTYTHTHIHIPSFRSNLSKLLYSSSVHSRMQNPSHVRPARPLRCMALACATRRMERTCVCVCVCVCVSMCVFRERERNSEENIQTTHFTLYSTLHTLHYQLHTTHLSVGIVQLHALVVARVDHQTHSRDGEAGLGDVGAVWGGVGLG
jgi:hypothetical protein